MLEFHARIIGGGAPTLEVNQLWAEFKQAIHNGISKYTPHKLAKSTNRKPWVSGETVRLLRQRNIAYTNQKSRLQEDRDRYKYLKSKAQRQVRNDYWTYLEDIVTPYSNGDTHTANKRFWSFIKHTRQDMTGIPNLLDDNGMEYTTPLTKAHALNQQFSSVFSKVTPTTLKDTTSRLLPPSYNPITITTAGISKLLCKLDPRKAPGPDNIIPRVLKELYFSIAPTLQVIYEIFYNDGVVPYDWLHANVCPIYKKGTRKAPLNYRPISLTCIACKIFEHIVTSSVMSHLDNQAILVDNQHGFRRGRSCETQLTELTHDLLTSMHNGRQTDMIVMDFSKAFDKVSHNKLISSLHEYGIDSTTLEWIRSFLSGRTQSVVVDGAESEDHHTLQADLDTLVQWEREFSMECHPKKCNILRVSRSRCPSTYN